VAIMEDDVRQCDDTLGGVVLFEGEERACAYVCGGV